MEKFKAILSLFNNRVVTILQPMRGPYSAKLIRVLDDEGWTVRYGHDTLCLDLQNITDLYIDANQRLTIRIKRELN